MTDSLGVLSERAAVIDVITALFVETDNRNWPAVLQCADAAAPEPVRV